MPTKRRLSYIVGVLAVWSLFWAQPATAASVERASVDGAGVQANDVSDGASISADGRFVAFESLATLLVAGDTNGVQDIFVHDRSTGTTERMSVNSAGGQANSASYNPSVSPDGRFVAFYSFATNLVAGDTNGATDVFVHDRVSGTTGRVSINSAEIPGDGDSSFPAISAGGRYVAFVSEATNLVAGDTNGELDIFVRDRQAGTTERVSVSSGGAQANAGTGAPAISADGRFVAFPSGATNLVAGDTNGETDVFVHDRLTDATQRVSVSGGGAQANGLSTGPSLSADGRFVAFYSDASNLVPGDTNGRRDVFLYDRLASAIERVSVSTAGAQGNANSYFPSVSHDGRFVAFESIATNLTFFDLNGAADAFVRDRLRGATLRASSPPTITDGASGAPSISSGRFVAFESAATNLVAGDTNGADDIFVRDSGLLPDGRNDFLADFGGAGTWQRLNDTTWQKIHNASPTMAASGDLDGSLREEAVMSFGGSGVWARFNNATWVKLHNGAPSRIAAGDFDGNGTDDLITDFGAAGIWVRRNNSAWAKLHNGTSRDLAVGDLDGNGRDELIADFGAAGLWVRYNGTTWAKRHNASPVHLATGDLDGNGREELIADFGSAGLWARYNNATWAKLHNAASQDIATGDLDGNDQEELVVDFGAAGLWARYNNATWTKLHNASPTRMLATDLDGGGMADLVVDFGAAGLWVRYDNATWTKIHPATTQDLAAGGFD